MNSRYSLVVQTAHPLGVRVFLLPRGDLTSIGAKEECFVVVEFGHRQTLQAVQQVHGPQRLPGLLGMTGSLGDVAEVVDNLLG